MRVLSSNNTVTVRLAVLAIMGGVYCDVPYVKLEASLLPLVHVLQSLSTFHISVPGKATLRKMQADNRCLPYSITHVLPREPCGLGAPSNNTQCAPSRCPSPHVCICQVFDVEDNDVSPKMLAIVAEKLAVNRAVRRDLTFVDCLHMKYPRVAPRPVLADPR